MIAFSPPWRHFLFCLALIAPLALLTACAGTTTDPNDDYVERPVEELYQEANTAMEAGQLTTAAKLFDEVERQHPYSQWATRAQLMAAHAYYQGLKYDEAILALERFIQLHPGHGDIAYAYYLLALCHYEQINDVKRDQDVTRAAQEALETITRRFPNSEYAKDAPLKIDLTLDHLAGKEMDIGRFYQKRGTHAAAIRRFRKVVKDYQTTSHVPEALHRLTESNLVLGLVEEATRNAAVLGHNYPGSRWYQDSYRLIERDAEISGNFSWLDQLTSWFE